MEIFYAVAAAALVAAVFFLSRKTTSGEVEKPASKPKVETFNTPEAFSLAVDPCACGKPVMYTLHTCLHCVHLKHFLDDHGIEHHLVYVDEFEGEQRSEAMRVLRTFNPRGSFPTLILPDGRVSVGYREKVVKELFGLDN